MKIHHIQIIVKNLDKSIEFYQKLGFVEGKHFVKNGIEYVFMELDGFKLELKESSEEFIQGGIVHIAFEVKNVDEHSRILDEKGIKVTIPPTDGASGGRFCFVKDPDGIDLEFYEE